MKTINNNTSSKLQALKDKQAKELKTLEIEENIAKMLDLELDMFINIDYNNVAMAFIDLSKTEIKKITPILKKIISVYTPLKQSHEIDYKGKITHKSPFILRTQSNIRSEDKIILEYTSTYNIRITLPIKFYSDDILGYYSRGVNDTEYHYYGGVSMSEIRNIKITFRKFDMFQTLNYYGGSSTCIITDKEDLKDYNFMAINGHLSEFGDFWEEQKKDL